MKTFLLAVIALGVLLGLWLALSPNPPGPCPHLHRTVTTEEETPGLFSPGATIYSAIRVRWAPRPASPAAV
jgi:hypothetical protein